MEIWKKFLLAGGSLLTIGAVARSVSAATGGKVAAGNARVRIQNGTMYGPGGLTYVLTNNDLLWLGRAMLGEASSTEGRKAVAWAMAENFMAYHGPSRNGSSRPRMGPAFANLLRAYCQPINPKWARGGPGCVSSPQNCTEQMLQRRERIVGTSYNALPSDVKSILQQFQAGTLSNPVPGMTDWHANNWRSGSKVPTVEVGHNWFGIRDYMRAA